MVTGTTYSYRAQAHFTVAGEPDVASNWSNSVNATPTESTSTAPGVPTSVSLTTIDHDSVRLTWSAGSGDAATSYSGRNQSRDKRKLYKQRNSIKSLHPQRPLRRHPIPRPSPRHKLCRIIRLLVAGQRDDILSIFCKFSRRRHRNKQFSRPFMVTNRHISSTGYGATQATNVRRSDLGSSVASLGRICTQLHRHRPH